jgi:spermidine synthase
VYEARSPLSGCIRVVDVGRERRLVIEGSILSVYRPDGNWTAVQREYWWHALAAVALPARPAVLFVGLGGGTQLHLLRERVTPRRITVIERDPVIVRVATRWFGLDRVGGVEFLCTDAALAVQALRRARRRFDFIMEDATYADAPEDSIPLARDLAHLVTRRGALVVNRHRRGHARETAAALAPHFADVRLRRVRREADNVLVCCSAPR